MKKRKLLVIIDMQNDFLTGSLANEDAVKIIPFIKEKINEALQDDTLIVFTKDSHYEGYLNTQEGKNLPVEHCIKGTSGHDIADELFTPLATVIEKNTFGSTLLASYIADNKITDVKMVGTCTDICVVSNALLIKAHNPEVHITVYKDGCAGTTVQNHEAALQVMRCCQIEVK